MRIIDEMFLLAKYIGGETEAFTSFRVRGLVWLLPGIILCGVRGMHKGPGRKKYISIALPAGRARPLAGDSELDSDSAAQTRNEQLEKCR